MKRDSRGAKGAKSGPSQRQLRAGELVRHALVDILRAASVTVTEVRLSPDFRHAICFVEPLGGAKASEVVEALNRHAKFLRGKLGRSIILRFTPELKFIHDPSFDEAARMNALFNRPEVRRDLDSPALDSEEG
jgi:ribosome-binding factor A